MSLMEMPSSHLVIPPAGTRDPVKIVANIFISFIGAGILGLPYAFKRVK